MDLKQILKQLNKEKDKLKYLEEQLKKTKDKKLKTQIEKLIEDLKEETKKSKVDTLEQIALSQPQRLTEVPTEKLENYQSRTRTTSNREEADIRGEEPQPQESYGSNIKSDYILATEDRKNSLENSGLTSKTGFNTTAESKDATRRASGKDYQGDADYGSEKTEEYSERGTIEQIRDEQEMIGMSHDQRQAKKGKRKIEQYHGQ